MSDSTVLAVLVGIGTTLLLWVLVTLLTAARHVGNEPNTATNTPYTFYPGQDVQLCRVAGELTALLPAVYAEAQFIDDVDLTEYYNASSTLLEELEILQHDTPYVSGIYAIAQAAGACRAEIELLYDQGSASFRDTADRAIEAINTLTDWLVVEDVEDEN